MPEVERLVTKTKFYPRDIYIQVVRNKHPDMSGDDAIRMWDRCEKRLASNPGEPEYLGKLTDVERIIELVN